MAILEIIKMGDPKLRIKSLPVTDFSAEALRNRVLDMVETMRFYQGVGLAAPQIGLSQQIIVLEVTQNKRYPQAENIELDVLINPKITHSSEQTELGWEGCLSLPGLRGQVVRSSTIGYEAFNLEGELLTKTVSGFHARIIQHEMDHLNGILYSERLNDMTHFGFEESLPAFQSAGDIQSQ